MFSDPITPILARFECQCIYPLWHLKGDPVPQMDDGVALVHGECPICIEDSGENVMHVSARTSYASAYTAVFGLTYQSGYGYRYRAAVKTMLSDVVVFHEWFMHPDAAKRWIERYYPHRIHITDEKMAHIINNEAQKFLR